MERMELRRTSGGSETTSTIAAAGEIESKSNSHTNVSTTGVVAQQPRETHGTSNDNSAARATSTDTSAIPGRSSSTSPAVTTVASATSSTTENTTATSTTSGAGAIDLHLEATGAPTTTKLLTNPAQTTAETAAAGSINKGRVGSDSASCQPALESAASSATAAVQSSLLGKESCCQQSVTSSNSENNEESVPKPVPNFRVEGTGAGDSSITVALASLTSAVGVNSCLMDNLVKTRIDNNVIEGDGQPGSGSGPVSVQSSEEMRLSLVSWYSEPDNNNESASCCSKTTTSNLMSSSAEEIEKENKTPLSCLSECASVNSINSSKGHKDAFSDNNSNSANTQHGDTVQNFHKSACNKGPAASGQRIKMHVQLFEQKSAAAAASDKCTSVKTKDGKIVECPRCSRRSKSGTNTPAAPSRQPRRVVQSSKSTQELKKPIKSILKSESRGSGSGSGSGSEKQSSMDSLGSGSGSCGGGNGPSLPVNMTRSDSGVRAKFNFSNSDTYTTYPEDRIVSRLKRIEKYATLRLKKKPKALNFGDSGDEGADTGCRNNGCVSHHNKTSVGAPGVPTEMMSKSMSYLEKTSAAAAAAAASQSAALKRQGSLRLKKAPTQWDPCVTRGTRTSALRFQKMQESKAKTGGGTGAPSGSSSGGSTGNSGSTHSGSGDSIHYLPHHHHHHSNHNANVIANVSSGPQSAAFINNPTAVSNYRPHTAVKEKHLGAKVFSKLSSATGQTTSSNMKRIKQERGIQTEPVVLPHSSTSSVDSGIRTSPCPMSTSTDFVDQVEQIRNLKNLSQKYMSTALKYQEDLTNSEAEKQQLLKQLEESKTETKETIEFLQYEKSMVDESLAETKHEVKKWKEKAETIEKDSQTLCSSLVRLSEQHKQECLKAQALLQRLETQSQNKIQQLALQNGEGASSVHTMKVQVLNLIQSLLKTYKVSSELLTNAGSNAALGVGLDESDLSCSLLLPLITLLSNAFQTPQLSSSSVTSPQNLIKSPLAASSNKYAAGQIATTPTISAPNTTTTSPSKLTPVTSPKIGGGNSLQNLNQAILDREEAERLVQEEISNIEAGVDLIDDDEIFQEGDYLSLKREVAELNAAVDKLLCVIKVIVIHCDQKVSYVTSNIVQCLNSMEDERVGTIPQNIAQVQKSLEAWNEGSGGSNGTTQCKSSLGSPAGASAANQLYVGNGHAQF